MKLVTIFVAMIFALSASAYAQGRGNRQAKKTTVSGPKANVAGKAREDCQSRDTRREDGDARSKDDRESGNPRREG